MGSAGDDVIRDEEASAGDGSAFDVVGATTPIESVGMVTETVLNV